MSGRDLKRRYGFFRCDQCRKQWESSHVYMHRSTGKVREIIVNTRKTAGTAENPAANKLHDVTSRLMSNTTAKYIFTEY